MRGGKYSAALSIFRSTSFTSASSPVVQSLNTYGFAIVFEIIGRDNPLAATTFAFLSAAYAFAIVYMPVVDGWGYGLRGVAGAFAVDAGIGIAACLMMGLLLFLLHRTDMERLPVQAQAVG